MPEPAVSLRIDKLVAGGEGLGRLADGCVVFVPAVAAAETVEVELVERRRDFARAHLVRISEPSADRVTPPCVGVSAGCGGCDWQHLALEAQATAKRDIVDEAFRRTGRLEVEVTVGPRLSASARRTTVRAAADGRGLLGFRRGSSDDVIVIGECLAAHPRISEVIGSLRLDGPGEVTIRVGARTGDIALGADGARIISGAPDGARLGPRSVVTEVVADRTFEVSLGSFFQSSPEAAESLVAAVTTALDDAGVTGGRLVDLYGGVGLFARTFADRFDEVFVVEGDAMACRDAVRNLQNCAATVECCDVHRWSPTAADVVIADPSRSGLGTRGVGAVAGTGADTVILVSCDAVAAARDARLLVDAGYGLGAVTSLDLFPHTHHVEVVSVFARR